MYGVRGDTTAATAFNTVPVAVCDACSAFGDARGADDAFMNPCGAIEANAKEEGGVEACTAIAADDDGDGNDESDPGRDGSAGDAEEADDGGTVGEDDSRGDVDAATLTRVAANWRGGANFERTDEATGRVNVRVGGDDEAVGGGACDDDGNGDGALAGLRFFIALADPF